MTTKPSDTPETDAFCCQPTDLLPGEERLLIQDWVDFARSLERRLRAAQAKIDSLMLEYCPDEMTPEQLAEWAKHQQPVSAEREAEIDRAAQRRGGSMAKKRKLTNKEKVRRKFPTAKLLWSKFYSGWGIYRDDEVGGRISAVVKEKTEAWADAARRLPK